MGNPKNARKPNTPTPDESEPAAKLAKITTKMAPGRKAPLSMAIPARAERVGKLLSCGQNEVGQLGFGEDVPEKTRPAAIPDCPGVVDISAGGMHSLYLNADGAVFSFGCNDEGALGRDTTAEGSEYEIVRVELPGEVVRISTGDSHSACLLADGRVLAWGSFRDSHGNMGLTLEGNKRFPVEVVPGQRFVEISSGADHLAMLTVDGKVFTVGCGEQGQLGRVTARSSGGESRRGKTELLSPGQVRFRLGVTAINAIWATTYCTFARVHRTDEIIGFGLNNYSQLAVEKHEDLFFTPKSTTITNVKAISGGQHHTLLLTDDDRCLVIGRRDYGRLGIGQVDEDLKQLTEVKALTGQRVVQVACGESCSFARTADGRLLAWGIGSNNQLGVGNDEDAYEPVLLEGVQVKGKEVLNVNGGGQHTLILVADAEAEAAAKKAAVAAAAAKKTAEAAAAAKKTAEAAAAAKTAAEAAAAAKKTAEAKAAKSVNGKDDAEVAAAVVATKSNGVGKKAVAAKKKAAEVIAEAVVENGVNVTTDESVTEKTANGDNGSDSSAAEAAAKLAEKPIAVAKKRSTGKAAAASSTAKDGDDDVTPAANDDETKTEKTAKPTKTTPAAASKKKATTATEKAPAAKKRK